MKTIYTIGANGSTPTVLLSVFLKYGITNIYDVRPHPEHHFAKCQGKYISAVFTKGNGGVYKSVPELAPTKKLLSKEKKYGQDSGEYLKAIGENGLRIAKSLIDSSHSPCLLCSEPVHEIDKCHRKALAEELANRDDGSYKVEHLDGWKICKESFEFINLHEGNFHSVLDIFNKVNETYFKSRYRAKDVILAWEEMPRKRTDRVLAYFRYPNLIAFNTALDCKEIPRPVLEAVMYHETLHLQRAHDGIPSGHTAEFYLEEAIFREYADKFRFDFSHVSDVLRKGAHL